MSAADGAARDGAARPVPVDRLADFEDAGDAGSAPSFSLPPRRPRRSAEPARSLAPVAPAARTPAPDPSADGPGVPGAGQSGRASAPEISVEESQVAEPSAPAVSRAAVKPATKAAPRGARGRQAAPVEPDPGTVGADAVIRPSNVHIPVSLLEPIATKKRELGLSNGEIIILAIESTYDRLPALIHPVTTTGGSLFAARRARSSRKNDGPLTPLNYRLRVGDFETLDRLVGELNASSRGHLITTALTAYFDPH